MIKNLFVLVCGALLCIACSDNSALIYDTEWTLTSLKSASGENIAISTEKAPNLKIEKSGNAFGYAGCNQFRGMAKIEKNTIKFDGVAMTRMMCLDNTVENAFSEMLNTAEKFEVKGGKLIIKKGDKELAEFTKE